MSAVLEVALTSTLRMSIVVNPTTTTDRSASPWCITPGRGRGEAEVEKNDQDGHRRGGKEERWEERALRRDRGVRLVGRRGGAGERTCQGSRRRR